MNTTNKFEPLGLLLKANSKDGLVMLCNDAFKYRGHVTFPDNTVRTATDTLNINQTEAKQMLESLKELVKEALFVGSTDPADIKTIFPDDFHKSLGDLLTKILVDRLPEWRNEALSSQVSLPCLVDMNWRVDVKMASDSLHRMSVPTCILQMKVQDNNSKTREPETCTITVELSEETLNTMLDGLGKIRDQLSSVARKA